MLLDDLAAALCLNGTTQQTFSILNLNGKGIRVEGAISIKNCTTVRIDFALGKASYSVLGENLCIKNLTHGSVVIKGQIFGCFDNAKIKL